MKIIKKRNKAVELGKFIVELNSNEEYIKVLEWHKELGHKWRSGANVFNEESINYFRNGSTVILTSYNFYMTLMSYSKISFQEFLQKAYI